MTLAPHVPVVIVPKVTKLVEPAHVLTAVFSTLSSDKSVLTSVKVLLQFVEFDLADESAAGFS